MSQSPDDIRHAYDMASAAYARQFLNELDHKPFDRDLLERFAATVGPARPVLDVGCGPGHTTAFLHALGLEATGVDLSPQMVWQASSAFPGLPFVQGDFFALEQPADSIAGVLAFYCIVHLTPDQLRPAFSEMYRVLTPGGVLLLSFHVGDEVVHADSFLDTAAVLDFSCFQAVQVEDALRAVGFSGIDTVQRAPYEIEYPSTRGYVFARKPNRSEAAS